MARLAQAEGVRRPFGRSKRGREDQENGLTQDQLYEVQQRLLSGAAES